MDSVLALLASILATLSPNLHQPPTVVRTSDRLRECYECGSLQSKHDCPFVHSFAQMARKPLAQQHQAVAPGMRPLLVSSPNDARLGQRQAAPSSSAAAPPASRQAGDGQAAPRGSAPAARLPQMCGQWRDFKTCKQQGCTWLHPADHVAPLTPTCQQFLKGTCTRAKCNFLHAPQPQLPERAASASAASPAPPAAEAADDPPPAAPASAAQPSASSQQPAPAPPSHKRKGTQGVDQRSSKPGGSSAAAAPRANSFQALSLAEAEEAEEAALMDIDRPRASSPPRPVPVSSLAALASPSRLPAAASRASSITRATSASASAAAASAASASGRR